MKYFENTQLYNLLTSLGKFYPLSITFNEEILKKELTLIDPSEWVHYNKSKPHIPRKGLSLYSLNGETTGEIDLNSIREYNLQHDTSYEEGSFKTPTRFWKSLPILSEPLKELEPHLGRSHLIRFGGGGFFPPHRDIGNCFRLITFFNTGPDDLFFILDNKKMFFIPNVLYFFDARITHTVFSTISDSIILVLNVRISPGAIEWVYKSLSYK